MATQTPLHHPDEAAQNERFFRFRVTVRAAAGTTYQNVSGLVGLKAAYEPSEGGRPDFLQAEAPTLDKVLIQGWHPAIAPRQQIVLTYPDGVTVRHLRVDDVVPGDSGPSTTLLTVTPWQSG